MLVFASLSARALQQYLNALMAESVHYKTATKRDGDLLKVADFANECTRGNDREARPEAPYETA